MKSGNYGVTTSVFNYGTTEATMEKAIFELAKILRDLCKTKEEYIQKCKESNINEKYWFLDELFK